MANMDTFELLGHPVEYWIDLQSNAEVSGLGAVTQENIRLKATLYDIQVIVLELKEMIKR
jgi:hypothetical protein